MAAATGENYDSELDDSHHRVQQHQHVQEYNYAPVHIVSSELDDEAQPTMPDAAQPADHFDRARYEALPDAGACAQHMVDMHDQLQYDDGGYGMQEQLHDQEANARHQTTHYGDEHYAEAHMPPEMTQPFAADDSSKAHAGAEFERVAAQDHHGFDDTADYASDRSHPPKHQIRGYIWPQQLRKPKSKKNSSRKPKKPPRSHTQTTATRNDVRHGDEASYPTPVTAHQTARQARLPPHQDQEDVYEQREQAWEAEHREQARQNTPEQQIDRQLYFAASADGHRPFSAGLRVRSARQNDVLPVSPPPTRSALQSHSAPRPIDLPLASRHSAASTSVVRQRLDSRSASKQQVAPQRAPRFDAAVRFGDATPLSDRMDLREEVSRVVDEFSRGASKKEAKIQAKCEELHSQLVHTAHEKQIVENQCYTLQQELQNLQTEIQKFQGNLAGFRKLKTFVDGIGRDLDLLRRDANTSYVKSDQLCTESSQRQDLQESLLQELHDRAEKATQLRTQALQACREVRSELSNTAAQCSQLQKELNTKDKLLADEKIHRLQLQAQLKAAGHDNEAVIRLVKSNNEAVQNKLCEMLCTLEESRSKREVAESLGKITAAVQNLDSRPTATSEDVVAVKVLVESLAENIAKPPNDAGEVLDPIPGLKACIDESLNSLKAELRDREELATEASTCREIITGLTEKLKMNDERALEYKTQLSESQARENETNEANTTLRSKVAELEKAQITNAASAPKMHEIEADLRAKASALDAMRAELDAKKEDLASLQAANASLQDEVKSLQQQLAELSAASIDVTCERAEWEKKIAAAKEETRVDMAKHIKERNDQAMSALNNENKKLSRQSDKHKDTEKKLRDIRSELENARRESSTTKVELQEKLAAANELSRSHARKAEALQNTVTALQNSTKSSSGKAKEFQEVKIQLQKEKSEVERLGGMVQTLEKQIEEERASASNAATETQSAQREVETTRAEAEAAKEQLVRAQKQIAEHEKGIQRHRDSSKVALEEEKESSRKKQAALHDQLQEVKADLDERQRKDQAFHAQVEESWRTEQVKQEAALTAANSKVLQAEAERDKAQATAEALRQQLEQTSKVSAEKEHSRAQNQTPAMSKGQATIADAGSVQPGAFGSQMPKQSKGITPDAASDFMQPTKPRKRVDRNSQSIKEISAIPTPDVLRPSIARPDTAEDESVSRGRIVEESQQGLMGPADMPKRSSPFGPFNPFEVDRSAAALKPPVLSDSRYRDVVPETQFAAAVPSFAEFNASRSSTHRKVPLNDSAPSQYQTAPEFTIYEDADEPVYANAQDAPHYLQDSLPAAKDPYLFEKAIPPPNSSSKLVRNQSDTSQPSRGSSGLASNLKKADHRNSSQPKTPKATNFPGQAGPTTLSSSPGFVTTSKPARTTNTYHATTGNKRRTSRRQSDVAQETAAKRKSETSIVTGYEEERRKRVKPATAALTPTRAGLGSMSRPTGTENSHASVMSELSIPRTSSRAGSQASRMQTLAGQPARSVRGTKKQTRHDQMNARFAQELNMARR